MVSIQRIAGCLWKFGLSWQMVPVVMNAMLKLKKLDIATLQEAHDG
jgi:predicted 3-demethylubiquinone-9 3-methyltransferase (glyoxalase superfamily)